VREALIPSGGVTVACAGSTVVGALAIARESNVSWIKQLYVAPGHTGEGVGTRLLNHALASLELPVRLYAFRANTRGPVVLRAAWLQGNRIQRRQCQ
jgi:GNAT superfamily N-acetyltransferase